MTELHLVVWKRPKMTELVTKTIVRNTKPGTYILRWWSNNIDNIGLEAARQKLLKNTNSEYFVCIDNDCLPPPIEDGVDWLEKMVGLMEKYPGFGAISMRTQVMIGTGNIFEEADRVGDDIVEFPHPGGSFRIMRTEAVRSVGGWDRGAEGRGAEERYIGEKLNKAGYRTAFATNIRCLHLFGLRGENGTDRWGYDASYKPEDTGHSDIHHPALVNGDDLAEVEKYAGKELTDDYSSN